MILPLRYRFYREKSAVPPKVGRFSQLSRDFFPAAGYNVGEISNIILRQMPDVKTFER